VFEVCLNPLLVVGIISLSLLSFNPLFTAQISDSMWCLVIIAAPVDGNGDSGSCSCSAVCLGSSPAPAPTRGLRVAWSASGA
jgi:hypothetical protein